ncbi:MAG TPA: DUF1501 domain-containing protein [Gemmataceae bacterium]|jgi:hypothetical protein|nr:DUF1501 domain-containing protein [Gemmataceae bacterium]
MHRELQTCVNVAMGPDGALNRRGFLRRIRNGAAGLAGLSVLDRLTVHADELKKQQKACILLWMAGGPSQFETFDPKPGAETQGPTRVVATAAPGIQIAEHWKHTAGVAQELAFIRSMTSKEGNHGRATYLLHTSYPPSGGIVHPGFGSIVASEIGKADFDLPQFVSIQGESVGPSFLGVQYAPFVVNDPNRAPDHLASPVAADRLNRRLGLLRELEQPFAKSGAADQVRDHQALYEQTSHLVLSPRVRAFDLAAESEKVRAAYGRSSFGQGCLMARRLIETGVTFVEVQSTGWDTHGNELKSLQGLIPPVDQGMAALIADLKLRGLLERTLVIWMGEFGRTPRINLTAGRDHFPRAFNMAMAGCGVKGGRVIGATDKLGTEVADRPVTVSDLFCTFCQALGINPRKENQSNVGRPVKIVEEGSAVQEVF